MRYNFIVTKTESVIKTKKIKAIISIFLILVIIAGGYVGNMLGAFNKGNYGDYSLKNTQAAVSDSPISGNTVIFLGSSVTAGYGSLGVSFADFLEKTDGITAIKEAVSGTTLVDCYRNSYVLRIQRIDKNLKPDAIVCQLSTNDATKSMPLGVVEESFDVQYQSYTVAGAIEYIIAYAKETWNCPVVFYTQPKYDSEHYAKMVDLLLEIQKKWDITVIDLWNSEEINSITDEQRKIYLVDHIHPTKAGYKEWWLPEFQKCLYEILK